MLVVHLIAVRQIQLRELRAALAEFFQLFIPDLGTMRQRQSFHLVATSKQSGQYPMSDLCGGSGGGTSSTLTRDGEAM